MELTSWGEKVTSEVPKWFAENLPQILTFAPAGAFLVLLWKHLHDRRNAKVTPLRDECHRRLSVCRDKGSNLKNLFESFLKTAGDEPSYESLLGQHTQFLEELRELEQYVGKAGAELHSAIELAFISQGEIVRPLKSAIHGVEIPKPSSVEIAMAYRAFVEIYSALGKIEARCAAARIKYRCP